MPEEKSSIENAAAIFRRPVYISGRNIYGIIYNKEQENKNKMLHIYMSYVLGMEQFLHNGGNTDDNKRTWELPDGYNMECNTELHTLIYMLLKNFTKFGIIEFDEPLEYTPDEIDGGVIVGKSFMERYVFNNPNKIVEQ